MSERPYAIGKSIPVLASLDMARTLEFYAKLGFTKAYDGDPGYGIVCWGDVEIHFWACDDRHIAENTSCYIRVADIQAMHALIAPHYPLQAIRETPWGMAEFYVWDPDGNLVKFGQPMQAD